MRLALDTNVIVRYVIDDDPIQNAAAAAVIESSDTLVISTVTLCELCWVLRRPYRFSPVEIAQVIRGLIESDRVEVDRIAVEAGLAMLASGGGFADGCIVQQASEANCEGLLSFDSKLVTLGAPFVRLPG